MTEYKPGTVAKATVRGVTDVLVFIAVVLVIAGLGSRR